MQWAILLQVEIVSGKLISEGGHGAVLPQIEVDVNTLEVFIGVNESRCLRYSLIEVLTP
jgi:hypothetical protein